VNNNPLPNPSETDAAAPEISVVLIFFNSERFLAEAIESVLAQSFADFELILVDDGSTDGSTAVALGYAERFPGRVRYLTHEGRSNRGMAASRNRGAAVARGNFLAFLDSDDVWMPRKLEEQLEILRAHPQAALVCGAILYWHSWDGQSRQSDGAVLTAGIGDKLVLPPKVALKAYPLGTSSGAGVDFLVVRPVFKALGGFEDVFHTMFEDQSFLLKAFVQYPVYLSSKVWLKYRQHPESCCALTEHDGSYAVERVRFFDWFDHYIATQHPDPCIVKALARARLRKPQSKSAALLRRLAKGVLRRLLPPGNRPLGDLLA